MRVGTLCETEKYANRNSVILYGIKYNRYVLWPRDNFWHVPFKSIEDGKLIWLPIAGKPFDNEEDAWQSAYAHWENHPASKGIKEIY